MARTSVPARREKALCGREIRARCRRRSYAATTELGGDDRAAPRRRSYAAMTRATQGAGRLASPRRGLDRARCGGLGELARQQVVAQVPGGDVDDRTALAERLHVLEQDRLRHPES